MKDCEVRTRKSLQSECRLVAVTVHSAIRHLQQSLVINTDKPPDVSQGHQTWYHSIC